MPTDEKVLVTNVARALWRASQSDLPKGGPARKEAFKAERKAYMIKARSLMRALDKQGLKLTQKET